MRNLAKSSLVAFVAGSAILLGGCDVPPSQEVSPVEQVEQAPFEIEIDLDGKTHTKTVTKPAPIPKYVPPPVQKPAAPAPMPPKAPAPKTK